MPEARPGEGQDPWMDQGKDAQRLDASLSHASAQHKRASLDWTARNQLTSPATQHHCTQIHLSA